MLGMIITQLLLASVLLAQDYAWPIKASQSLSATFCEYRNGHLHAGVDIKTWGEMEVPCLAIADGYIERVIVNYNGYGRGLFLRTKQGHVVVYGHLERFLPEIERRIAERQLELDRYEVRIQFQPNEFPMKKGQPLAWSGTSGTEHPHLHFEIRDSSRTVLNPQLFYPRIKDSISPILEELLLIPVDTASRVSGSRQAQIVDLENASDPVRVQGAIRVAVNAHDRQDGTFNKYNFYSAELYLNDSLAFKQSFDQLPLGLSDNVSRIYPGARGKRGWRFMTLYEPADSVPMPFAGQGLTGRLTPQGLSTLQVRVADIRGNQDMAEILLRQQTSARWEVKREHGHYVIVRHYPPQGYERFQFYSGTDTFIPIAQTLHTRSTTSWELPQDVYPDGVRALGAMNGEIKWLIPTAEPPDSNLAIDWHSRNGEFFFSLHSNRGQIYPLAYELAYDNGIWEGELTQISGTDAESGLMPLEVRATATELYLMIADEIFSSRVLEPFKTLAAGEQCRLDLELTGLMLEAFNTGPDPLYIRCDTVLSEFEDREVIGFGLQAFGNPDNFLATAYFTKPNSLGHYDFYKPDSRQRWKLLDSQDSAGVLIRKLRRGGEFFILQDNEAPRISAMTPVENLRAGQRLVFGISDNTGNLPLPRRALSASLDGKRFFPDYNPLRGELSFHVSEKLSSGAHRFELTVTDAAGNQGVYTQTITVR